MRNEAEVMMLTLKLEGKRIEKIAAG